MLTRSILRCRTEAATIFLALCLLATGLCGATPSTTRLEVKAFPVEGCAQDPDTQALDFRYAPARWQTCIGLPDDPHKSIIGSDGGLYYDYGGGRFHDFKTRILAELDVNAPAGDVRQRLHDARTPIVITEQDWGDLTLQQYAWARVPEGGDVDRWREDRVDYLWLRLINEGAEATAGRIAIQIDPKERVVANESRDTLFDPRHPERAFAAISPACDAVEYASKPDRELRIDHVPGTHRNWARPTIPCDERFRDVLVGWSRPLIFAYPAEPNEIYHVAFGLIEGYHAEPGIRPLELRIEDRVVRTVDLVPEFGRNQPAVLRFEGRDRNGDGLLEMGVHPREGAEDTNTILSALWVFDADAAPDHQSLLEGAADAQALAVADIQRLAHQSNRLKVRFAWKILAPGESSEALLTVHRGGNASARTSEPQAREEYDRAVRYWSQRNLPYDRIRVPDTDVQDLLDSCIRNIYQAREIKDGRPAFQVGPTCYRGTWAADGPFILEAITYLGRAAETRAGLEHQVDQDQGPGGVEFSKKSGLRLWMIWRHAQLTGDWPWLRTMWTRVEREVEQIKTYRRMTMDDPHQANYGLMPIGFGDGGLGGRHREYTNVYWTLAGLQAAIEIADRLGRSERHAWQTEYRDYWQHLERARQRDKRTDAFGNVYVPVTMTGEAPQSPQRGAWAFLQSIFPGRIFAADDELMRGTMAMLEATEKEGLIHGTGWLPDGIWNYAGSFYAHAQLWLGRGSKAADILYAFANHAGPLLSWREEQNLVGQPETYCGDMPHNWASAEFTRLIRHLLILERGAELHLLEGLPTTWTGPGDTTHLTQIPTSFGEMSASLEVASDGRSATLTCRPPRRERIDRLVVHTEHFSRRVARVTLADRELDGPVQMIPADQPFTLTLHFAN